MTPWTNNKERLRSANHTATIEFLPTAQSKSVAVVADTHANAHTTPTHLLPPPAKATNKVSALTIKFTGLLTAIAITASGQLPVIQAPKPATFQRYDMNNYGVTRSPNTPTNQYQYSLDQNERNRQIMQEVDDYSRNREEQNRAIEEALAGLTPKARNYRLTTKESKDKKYYVKAFNELNAMLNSGKLDLKKAVFTVEHAYDTTLNYERFKSQINKLVEIVGLKMKQDKISPTDNMGKIMTLFKFMADTITVKQPTTEKRITTYPKMYDFEDFYGMHDYSKMFVSKLIRTGTGQYHSLPLLYLILAQEIGAKAYLSTSPQHFYVKFVDELGSLQNIELTNRMFTTDQFILQSGYVKASAIKNKIYMDTLGLRKMILAQFNDLANGYTKKFGYDNFMIKCGERVLTEQKNNIISYMHVANYYNGLAAKIQREYKLKGWGQREFERDNEARKIFNTAIKLNDAMDNLGFAEMPPEIYSNWLNMLQSEDMKQQHLERKQLLKNMIEH
jgi:hypothetical protein